MHHADAKSSSYPPETLPAHSAARAVPTFIATDLLEKLIADRDALAVHKVVIEGRRN